MKTLVDTPPCKECGAPVAIREVPTTSVRHHLTRFLERRVCTNPACRTRELLFLAP